MRNKNYSEDIIRGNNYAIIQDAGIAFRKPCDQLHFKN